MSRTVVDATDLERRVKDMYTRVALEPQARYHFEMGRAMASRLGYTDNELDTAPAASIESFERIRDRLVERGASDGFVTDFGHILSLFFRDPDGNLLEIYADI